MGIDSQAHRCALAASAVLAEALGDQLVGVYLHGSAVLGGFRWDRSDLDVLVLVNAPLTDGEVSALPPRLASLVYPANGLELSVLTESEAMMPSLPAPHFQLHVATDGWDRRLTVVDGRSRSGDPDLVLHLAVCREAGHALVGPPPARALAEVPLEWVNSAAVDEIRWALSHDPPPEYVVLTAARAWFSLATGRVVSKVDAGRWALGMVPGEQAATVEAALLRQTGFDGGLTRREATSFAQGVLRRVADATPRTGQ